MQVLILTLAKSVLVHSLTDYLYGKYKEPAGSYSWTLRAVSAFVFFGLLFGTWHYLTFVILAFYLCTGLVKEKMLDSETAFIYILDYIMHIGVLTLVGVFIFNIDLGIVFEKIISSRVFWLVSAGFITVLAPAGNLIGKFTQKWSGQIEKESSGLKDAGVIIGYLERTLILIFILTNRMEAIGFLIAAKSIFRFGEIKNPENRKEAEYILIGTISSFAAAIIIGLLVKHLIYYTY